MLNGAGGGWLEKVCDIHSMAIWKIQGAVCVFHRAHNNPSNIEQHQEVCKHIIDIVLYFNNASAVFKRIYKFKDPSFFPPLIL